MPVNHDEKILTDKEVEDFVTRVYSKLGQSPFQDILRQYDGFIHAGVASQLLKAHKAAVQAAESRAYKRGYDVHAQTHIQGNEQAKQEGFDLGKAAGREEERNKILGKIRGVAELMENKTLVLKLADALEKNLTPQAEQKRS